MKNVVAASALLLLVSTSFVACQKEKQENDSSQPTTTTINQGNGIIETIERKPNGSMVVFSNWITKVKGDWTGFGTNQITTDLNTTSLTDDVKNRGLVLVYFEYAGKVLLLPIVALDYNQVTDFTFTTGKITLSIKFSGGGIAIEDVTDMKFRYILIPPSALGNPGTGRTSVPVDYSDYNAVCDYFGISH